MQELYVIVYVSITSDLDVLHYVQYFLNVIEVHDYMVSETSEESIPRLGLVLFTDELRFHSDSSEVRWRVYRQDGER